MNNSGNNSSMNNLKTGESVAASQKYVNTSYFYVVRISDDDITSLNVHVN